jgi:hypothetical protein
VQVRVEAEPPAPVVVDGEVVGTTPLTARTLPGSLLVIVPPPQQQGEKESVLEAVQEVAASLLNVDV